MKHNRKIAAILACLIAGSIAGTTLLTGCGAQDTDSAPKQEASSTVEIASGVTSTTTEKGTHIIKDVMGREVEVKEEIQSIIAIPWPWPSFVFALDGKADRITSMSATSLASYKNCMFQVLAPGLGNSDTNYIDDQNKEGGSFGTLNVEEIARINPDLVIIYKRDAETMLPVLESAGITTIVFDYGGLKEVQDGMRLLGQALGGKAEENAEKIIAMHEKADKMIKERVADLKDEDKPRVLHLTNGDLQVVTNSFNNNMIVDVGGVNVATEGSEATNGTAGSSPTVNFEQILAWDPDIIVLGNFSPIKPEEIYNNTLAGQDWSQLKAVKNKKVYKIPMGLYRWDAPNTEAHLYEEWMAKLIQPELFADIDMEAEIKNFYTTIFDHDVTADEMAMILHADLNKDSAEIK